MITVAEYNIDISCPRFCKLLIDWVEHIHKFDSIHTMQQLMNDCGYPIVHQRINSGIPMIAARSMYSTVFHGKEGEELKPLGGSIPEDEKERLSRGLTYLVSSRGNK